MTPRETRMLRLVGLRERQHDVAALNLRAAQGNLLRAESAMNEAQERTRAAQFCRLAAGVDDIPDEWMIACGDIEVSTLIAGNRYAHVVRAKALVQQASEAEATARRERKQMEATLEYIQRDSAERARRAELIALDEIVRMQRASSAADGPWGRDL
jgi:phage protein D